MDRLNRVGRDAPQPVALSTMRATEFDDRAWPVQPGNYRVIEPRAPIALLLVGEMLSPADPFFAGLPAIAVIGTLFTENIGLEYVVKNLISNPFIRRLVVIGKEVAGHRPADAILKLREKGLDANQRIIAARGARPVLRNLLPVEVDHFRRQITVHSLLDRDEDFIKKQLLSLGLLPDEPFVDAIRVRLLDTIAAKPAKRLQLDPQGYFIILIRPGRTHPLHVEHYKNSGELAHIIEGGEAATICATLIGMGLVSRLDHAAYLGRELARAENAVRTGTPYIQDRAQGEINPC